MNFLFCKARIPALESVFISVVLLLFRIVYCSVSVIANNFVCVEDACFVEDVSNLYLLITNVAPALTSSLTELSVQ